MTNILTIRNRQANARLSQDAGVDVVQPLIQEPLLEQTALQRIERDDVVAAVNLQELVLGAGAEETFDVAAQVQGHAAPIAGREQRHPDPTEVGNVIHKLCEEFRGYGALASCIRRNLMGWTAPY